MTLATAEALWGHDLVARALFEHHPEAVTTVMLAAIDRHDSVDALASWALTLPWPVFCAVVRVISGHIRQDVEEHDGR